MRIFIAWSGQASGLVAQALRDWLPKVIQSLKPFVSLRDIDAGSRWQHEIGSVLGQTNFGLLCLTPENLASPWIHFEAGALAKSLGEGRVVPLLLSVGSTDVKLPLSQFQSLQFDRSDISTLLRNINAQLPEKLSDSVLDESIDKWWDDLERRISEARELLKAAPTVVPQRPSSDVAEETLELVRSISRDVGAMGSRLERLEASDSFASAGKTFWMSADPGEVELSGTSPLLLYKHIVQRKQSEPDAFAALRSRLATRVVSPGDSKDEESPSGDSGAPKAPPKK